MKPGPYTFSISQKGDKHFERGSDYKYSYNRMIIMKLKNGKDAKDGVEYVGGCVSELVSRDNYLKIDHMESGDYAFYIEVDWNETAKKYLDELSYCATSYGPDYVLFEQNFNKMYKKHDIIAKALSAKALSGKFDKDFNIVGVNKDKTIMRYS